MTERWVAIAAVSCAALLCTILELLPAPQRSTTEASPLRQIIDVAPAKPARPMTPEVIAAEAQPVESTTLSTERTPADVVPPPEDAVLDLDIPHIPIEFGTRHLDDLLEHGTVVVPLPDGTSADLTLLDHSSRHGMTRIRVAYADMVSSITRRGDTYFATIATPTESYRIEGDKHSGRVYPHRSLAARTIHHEKDFRHVP